MKLPPRAHMSIKAVKGVFLFPTVQGYVKRESSASSIDEHVIVTCSCILDSGSEASFSEQPSFLTDRE